MTPMAGWRDGDDAFGRISRWLHWVTAALVLVLFGLGWYMEDLAPTPRTFEIYALHKSIGLTVLAVALVRIVWRLSNPRPRHLGGDSRAERVAAHAAHVALYALLIAVPLAGWIMSSAADIPITWFSLFQVPYLTGPSEAMLDLWRTVHWALGLALAVLVILHVAAALRHHLVLGNDTLRRMLGRGVRR